jgi:uncharacterized protein (DUF1697 family)
MARFVALLRGVNVGGHKLAMSELRAVCEEAGCTDVETYIQSGNVVLSSSKTASALRADLEKRISKHAGYSVPVALRTAKQIEAIVNGNPFDEPDGTKLHVAFLTEKPKKDALEDIDVDAFAPEELRVKGEDVYLHLPNGMGRGVIPVKVLPKLKVPATVRNWKTVLKLQQMLKA